MAKHFTEQEWESSPLSMMMLQLRSRSCPWKWSTRKARLFSVACCRRIGHLLDAPADHRAIEAAEEVAEKKMRLGDLRLHHAAASEIDLGGDPSPIFGSFHGTSSVSSPEWDFCYHQWIRGGRKICRVARFASTPTAWGSPDETANDARVLLAFRSGLDAAKAEEPVQCALLRDIVGPRVRPHIPDAWVKNNGGRVRSLVATIYDTLDFAGLPILADALEEAGCDDVSLLGHLRSSALHVRGCWSLELLLGKE
jgi:hypothetical protein